MTELRRRMIECLQRRGLSERTQDMYVRAVRQLAEHSRTSPDVITEEELRPYFLSITHVKQYSRSARTIALCGSQFFFAPTLHRDWTTLRFVRAPREKKLPVILSLEEVRKLLGCVRLPRDRVCLPTIYSWGLRLQEGTPLKVPDIDSSRMLIHVRHGKGGQDRDCPLAAPDAGTAWPVLGHAPSSSLDLPGTGAWGDLSVDRHRTDAQQQCTGSVPGSPHRARPPHARVCAHAAAFRGHPGAGGWRHPSAHASVPRTPLSHHDERLYTPDGQSCTTRSGRHQPPHEGSVMVELADIVRLHGPEYRATCGGRIGMVGVLHMWPRDLRYHPHGPDLVPGGGLTADDRWLPSRPDFLVHVKPLSVLLRAQFQDALHKTDLVPLVEAQVWNKDWVVHCEPVGRGAEAFRYLTPYLLRVAIRNNRLLTLQKGHVSFQYKESATDQVTTCTLPAEEFIRRFLQHVLPARFIKVRSDGLLSPTNRHVLTRARERLRAGTVEADTTGHHPHPIAPTEARALPRCPTCGSTWIRVQTPSTAPTGFVQPRIRVAASHHTNS